MPHIVSMDHIGLSNIMLKMELLNLRKEGEETAKRGKADKKGCAVADNHVEFKIWFRLFEPHD